MMKIEVLGCHGSQSAGRRTTCLLINDTIALDAGSLSQALPLERQRQVHSILLTHSHTDHTNSLPFFVENVYGADSPSIDLCASEATIYSLRRHLFNNASWPDFSRLPNHLLPSIEFRQLEDEVPLVIDGVRFTPIPVDHLVPTFGFLIEQGGAAVLWSSDTGPTVRLWEIANQTPNLRALCVDCSFDDSMQEIADISFHLTPHTLSEELEKLEWEVPILLHHLKPPSAERIVSEVRSLRRPDIAFLEQDRTYRF